MIHAISKNKILYPTLALLIILLLTACTQIAEESKIHNAQNTLVTEIVDGDTITVAGGTRIRLLGIDAPESNEQYYTESKEYLEEKILNANVKLESDTEDKDQYGRSLRYIWLKDELINAEIVRSGWAIAKQYEPNTKYSNIIAQAEQQAIGEKIGIWKPANTSSHEKLAPEIISYLDTSNYIGQTKTVEGTIARTFKYEKGNIIFLNFHDPYEGYFTAIIWKNNWNKFPTSPELYYKDKKVRVTGQIIDYEGSPEIVVSEPSQIKII